MYVLKISGEKRALLTLSKMMGFGPPVTRGLRADEAIDFIKSFQRGATCMCSRLSLGTVMVGSRAHVQCEVGYAGTSGAKCVEVRRREVSILTLQSETTLRGIRVTSSIKFD